MSRTRTTKTVAQRIDLNYFKRPTGFKRAKLALAILAPLLAIAWIAWRGFSTDSRVFSSGRMSAAHAVLEKQCEVCHLQTAGQFSAKAVDGACEACHDGPIHHSNQVPSAVPDCATCHREHRGRIDISAASNETCAECHANLRTASGGSTAYAAHIRTLQDGHPEVAFVRAKSTDPGTIKLNHYLHMQPIRRGPNGPIVQLICSDCHRPAAVQSAWTYADPQYVAAKVTYTDQQELLPVKYVAFPRPHGGDSRALMAPVQFATACAACHLLTFDKHFDTGVPHDTPQIIHQFLLKKFQDYIAAHPADLRVVKDPSRDLTGKPLVPPVRVLTPTQWVAERTADSEELLWRKTCKQCHTLTARSGDSLPQVAPANITQRWLLHARFDHDAHRGFSCAGCHSAATTSKEASDVLVPGIDNCKTCHAPGPDHAESRCFACHTYHDWSKRKEVAPHYTLPRLQSGH